MSPNSLKSKISPFVPQSLKVQWWIARRAVRSLNHRSLPRVFQTSIPKAGTHLLGKALEHLGFALGEQGLVNRDVVLDYDVNLLPRHLTRTFPGEYQVEHLPHKREAEQWLLDHGFKIMFIYRDPRATAVSFAHYVTEIFKIHRLHRHYASLPGMRERIMATLDGVPDECSSNKVGRAPLARLYDSFEPWLRSPHVYKTRFEDFVGARGGGSDEIQRATILELTRFLGCPNAEKAADEILDKVFDPGSATFRSGQIDGWRKEVDPDVLALMNQRLEVQLRNWGYPPE